MTDILEIKTDVQGVEEAVKVLQALKVDILTLVAPAFRRGALRAEAILKEYPDPIPDGLWARHSTRKMRAWWFAHLKKEGLLKKDEEGKVVKGKYRRTMTLGRRWTTTQTQTATSITAAVGNNTKYGPFVQSTQRQVGFHRGRWTTDKMALEQTAEPLVRDVQQTLVNALAVYRGGASSGGA